MIYCTSVYEDEITHQVILKIYELSQGCISESKAIHCNGKGKIKKQINAYNNAAQYGYYFVIADLDDDYECAALLVKDWLSNTRSDQLSFRVAVHEIESWLLADRENFAAFLSISQALIPLEPDKEKDPKNTIISLAKKSRKREIREAIVPVDSYASIGPGYNYQLKDFIQNLWNIESARKNSPSLNSAIESLEKIVYKFRSRTP
ncbi:MAG: DUF4276 family protein [Treponema sp.]|jgi:hypothetical protein|nr:DUF4276 family protein [Treponema sp.]